MLIEPLESRTLLSSLRFAAIGDFGEGNAAERDVARLVKGWKPDLVVTVGDNNYPLGAAATIDRNIGAYYHSFIYPYRGAFGTGAADGANHFFPTLGNHDWISGAGPYLRYFTLPGNERYYTFRRGPVQFFALDSDESEPDLAGGINSREARWLKRALAASTATWKIVYFHHPPYSSGTVHGSAKWMRWPFKQWGASAVLAGHEHNYERLLVKGLPYFVDGSGGGELYALPRKLPASRVRYARDYGAMLIDADDTTLTFRFITRAGKTIDTYTLRAKPLVPVPAIASIAIPSRHPL